MYSANDEHYKDTTYIMRERSNAQLLLKTPDIKTPWYCPSHPNFGRVCFRYVMAQACSKDGSGILLSLSWARTTSWEGMGRVRMVVGSHHLALGAKGARGKGSPPSSSPPFPPSLLRPGRLAWTWTWMRSWSFSCSSWLAWARSSLCMRRGLQMVFPPRGL